METILWQKEWVTNRDHQTGKSLFPRRAIHQMPSQDAMKK